MSLELKILLKPLPLDLNPTKKQIYKDEPSIVSKKKSKEVESVSAPKAPSSVKNRSSMEKEKGNILEPKEIRLGKSNGESNFNGPLYSQEEEDLEKPP